ncbi:hypothetical protein [Chitinophaga sancti]|uniref:Uncharacterized protein n=1 Tax=Chitinophaga sancti TaxID=1004 RepID=A0A1K1T1L9_9BACT|nr:hypothetical protein [Chitinophaga sancti]WQD61006.1 hypothetical protein U0033_24205 [Chitinophaga sancti]WQG86867.1 hypothetical protein SR876_18270 [Chitinophaga sancti]SFW90396.1 hypothetical protein SAMN05661012_06608 [Chitinophaga sancti]
MQSITKVVSYKYGKPKVINETFKKGGQFPKDFNHKVLYEKNEGLYDPLPKDDYKGRFLYHWNSDSIIIKLGYFKDYADSPIYANDGNSSITKSTTRNISGFTYEEAYRVSLYFESKVIKKIVNSENKKVHDSINETDKSKF